MTFADQFSGHADAYSQFRPSYPAELFRALAERAPGRDRAWDCATGSGQAAVGLAAEFGRVIATDGALRQVTTAAAHPRVTYVAALAERCPILGGSVAAVTIAQALHWVDRPAFFREVERVLVPGGVLAVWCYTLPTVAPGVDAVLRRFYDLTVGPYWLEGRALVDEGYRSVEIPFDRFEISGLAIERELALDEFAGYVGTWSAVQRCRRLTGADPMPLFVAEVAAAWGAPAGRRLVRWPLHVRGGVKRSRVRRRR